jgi:hypothetical protein
MDVWVAVVGLLSAVAVAAVTQLPGLTVGDRRRASIAKDLELLRLRGDGAAADELKEHIDGAIRELVASRRRDREFAQAVRLTVIGWLVTIAAVGLLVLSTAITADFPSAQLVRAVLAILSLGGMFAATVLVVGACVVVVRSRFGRRRIAPGT